jgi:hypothetical protein
MTPTATSRLNVLRAAPRTAMTCGRRVTGVQRHPGLRRTVSSNRYRRTFHSNVRVILYLLVGERLRPASAGRPPHKGSTRPVETHPGDVQHPVYRAGRTTLRAGVGFRSSGRPGEDGESGHRMRLGGVSRSGQVESPGLGLPRTSPAGASRTLLPRVTGGDTVPVRGVSVSLIRRTARPGTGRWSGRGKWEAARHEPGLQDNRVRGLCGSTGWTASCTGTQRGRVRAPSGRCRGARPV